MQDEPSPGHEIFFFTIPELLNKIRNAINQVNSLGCSQYENILNVPTYVTFNLMGQQIPLTYRTAVALYTYLMRGLSKNSPDYNLIRDIIPVMNNNIYDVDYDDYTRMNFDGFVHVLERMAQVTEYVLQQCIQSNAVTTIAREYRDYRYRPGVGPVYRRAEQNFSNLSSNTNTNNNSTI